MVSMCLIMRVHSRSDLVSPCTYDGRLCQDDSFTSCRDKSQLQTDPTHLPSCSFMRSVGSVCLPAKTMADDEWVVMGQKHRAGVPFPTNAQPYETGGGDEVHE
ncbi:hypothetical protein N7466_001587 [Penicillium verhagenii]|uniref:uncharacterized protein n=1 Tax=Penicillium verhagenii TaxID=1562060 RepID=UPI0025458617|nr:uncharacterized protein N7466_001587 [Penicillium verhagenii]KAJ5938453.1 hypothetical protein N7466_001587 [Penicillium verhagenii]